MDIIKSKITKEFSIKSNPNVANKLGDLLVRLYEQEKALTTDTGAALIPEKVDTNRYLSKNPKWIKYIANPYAKYIYDGSKISILSSVKFKKHLNIPIYIADKKYIYGIYQLGNPIDVTNIESFNAGFERHRISNEDLKKWWNVKFPLYEYPLETIRKFKFPFPYDYPKGFLNWIESSKILNKKVITSEGVDFGMIDLVQLYPESISELSDSQLISYHNKLHNLFNDEHRIKVNSPSNEVLYHIHMWIKLEMEKRKLEHVKSEGNLDELNIDSNKKELVAKKENIENDEQSVSTKFWKDNWKDMYPKSGTGKFVEQTHWRGLTEEETKLDYNQLLDTDNSVHGDLRFESNKDLLWGLTTFWGKTEDVKKDKGDRLVNIGDNKLESEFKLAQSKVWLDLKDGSVFMPGDPGSTTKAYSKLFVMDNGEYKAGTWKENFVEIFFDSYYLTGRYIVTHVPINGQIKWLISKPSEQRLYSETHSKEETISELKSKGQKYLWWRESLDKEPELIEIK